MSNKFDPNRPQADGRDPKSTRKVIKPATRPPGEVRLIGGQWKRSKLPVADRPGLRPTPDRVRETLFNWLGQELGGWRVLRCHPWCNGGHDPVPAHFLASSAPAPTASPASSRTPP